MTPGNRLKVEQEEVDKLEFRSEEVRDILGTMPHWTIRSGSGYLFGTLLLVLAATWFIKYPDTIRAPVILTTRVPPANIMAGSSGYLTLWVKDSAKVKENDYLGYINNASDVDAVLHFKKKMDSLKLNYYRDPHFIDHYIFDKGLSLGELQESFNLLARNIEEYQFAYKQKSYHRQIEALQRQVTNYNTLNAQLQEQNAIISKDLELSMEKYKRDSFLYRENVIAKADRETSERGYLKDLHAYKNAVSTITTNRIQTADLEKRIEDLEMQEAKENKDFLVAIETAMNQLTERLKAWEQVYMIKAPFAGAVAFFKYWSDHQYIKTGEEILTVIPENNNYFAQARVPVIRSGKIKQGQRTNIKIDNYPFPEYGMISGRIRSTSLLPRENTYLVGIDLPDGLLTSYDKTIPFRQEMSGQVEIITEDMRLMERFFFQIRKIFN